MHSFGGLSQLHFVVLLHCHFFISFQDLCPLHNPVGSLSQQNFVFVVFESGVVRTLDVDVVMPAFPGFTSLQRLSRSRHRSSNYRLTNRASNLTSLRLGCLWWHKHFTLNLVLLPPFLHSCSFGEIARLLGVIRTHLVGLVRDDAFWGSWNVSFRNELVSSSGRRTFWPIRYIAYAARSCRPFVLVLHLVGGPFKSINNIHITDELLFLRVVSTCTCSKRSRWHRSLLNKLFLRIINGGIHNVVQFQLQILGHIRIIFVFQLIRWCLHF